MSLADPAFRAIFEHVAIGIAVYVAMVKRFPLLSGVVVKPEEGAERTPVTGLAAAGR